MIEKIIRLIYPPKCIFCGKLLDIKAELEICSSCYKKINFSPDIWLDRRVKFQEDVHYDHIICACEYSGIIKKSLVEYKFFGKSGYYRALAKILSKKIKLMLNSKKFDIIICVPLHKEREKQRGYNQALLISKVISHDIGIPIKSDILLREMDTRSQSLLNREERHKNIKGAFKIENADIVSGKSVLLVDDIFTTGSTVDECSRVLKGAGAREVIVAVVASGRKY